jgi:signal transduction histidine kinase
MSKPKSTFRERAGSLIHEEGLARALRTHQVDAIVGERHIMLVRLKKAEDDLESSRDQLRALAAHLLSVRDSERVAIARELHDEFGQALTSLQLGLSWLSRNVTRGQRPLQTKIRSLTDTTTSLIRSVRNITVELRPGALDELGLVKTLESTAMEFKEYAGIPCGFRTNAAGVTFDRLAAVAVFRVVQAGLTNVARHAHASRVMLALMKSKTDLIVTVKDNGKGISEKAGEQNSLGLTGMRERVLALGGAFTLGGSRGKGTILTARIPLSRALSGATGGVGGERIPRDSGWG